jgi:hypothetical protein
VKIVDSAKVDRTTVVVSDLRDEPDDRRFWHSRTPAERLAALELMRQVLYGYDPSTTRLQRVLTVVESPPG